MVALGDDVSGPQVEQPVAVYRPWGCGRCARCHLDAENYCEDPASAAPLTDAGFTPYHANRRSWPKLPPGVTAVVIGTGRLGHLAIQILNAAAATVIAVDTRTEALDLALKKRRRPCQPEVLNPGARGLLRPDIVQFSLEQAMDAYRQM